MDFMLNIDFPPSSEKINLRNSVILVGSCFTEHIGNALGEMKFDILQHPNGILFDPFSVADSLVSYIEPKQYTTDDLFYLNECWQSWHHHGIFSHPDKIEVLRMINDSQNRAHLFLKKTKWLIITLGSSFSYRLTQGATPDQGEEKPVANCHRAPAQWFRKHLMTIEEINAVLDNAIHRLVQFNPAIRILFTISPVRHVRDGVTQNNRSKARLIEVVHHLAGKFNGVHYFPAYELVIDILRDYRFYDIDMVHPNYQATEYVLEKFKQYFIDEESQAIMREMKSILIAKKHRAFQPETNAHRQFLERHLEKTRQLKLKYPFLNLEDELNYFSGAG